MLKQFKFANDILLQGITARTQDQALEILRGKPFWLWQEERHKDEFINSNGNCCFNHILSCPTKNDTTFPLFDYEELIFNTIEQNQNIWIKKARGIGVTTFLIRYLVWKILYSNELDEVYLHNIRHKRRVCKLCQEENGRSISAKIPECGI